MFEIHPSNWPIALDPDDPRDQFHRIALADARVATERRPQLAFATRPGPRIVARLRLALAGAPQVTSEPCSCPA